EHGHPPADGTRLLNGALEGAAPPVGAVVADQDPSHGSSLARVCQYAVEGPRHAVEVERLDDGDGVALLAVPHEAVEVLLERAVAVRGLLPVGLERAQLALFGE